jgi:hypothetical protein
MSTAKPKGTMRGVVGGSLANEVLRIDVSRLARGPTEEDRRAIPATTDEDRSDAVVMYPPPTEPPGDPTGCD